MKSLNPDVNVPYIVNKSNYIVALGQNTFATLIVCFGLYLISNLSLDEKMPVILYMELFFLQFVVSAS